MSYFPNGFKTSRRATTLRFLGSDGSGADSNSYTFSGKDLGRLDANKYIIVAVCSRTAAVNNPTGCTIGGKTATLIDGFNTTGSVTYLYGVKLSDVTVGDIVVTFGSAAARIIVGWYELITHFNPFAPFDVKTDTTLTGAALSVSLNIPVGGVAIAHVFSNAAGAHTFTWSGLSEDYDLQFADTSNQEATGAGGANTFPTGQTDLTVTATGSLTPTTTFALHAVSFQ